jgi:hypothetical protein
MPSHPVFIVGMPRSGTTLLSTMLDAHPAICIAPETHFFTKCTVAMEDASPDAREQAVRFLQQEAGVRDMAITEEEWRTIRATAGDAPVDVLRALLKAYAARSGADVWGEKTPDHLIHVPNLMGAFPDAAVLAITRDPRDVYLSQQPMPWNRDTIVETAWTWRTYARRVERYRSAYGDRFHDLRYEDLLRHPERELRRICRLLAVDFNPAMLSFHERADAALSAEPWKRNARRPVDPSNTEKWRGTLAPAQRWVLQAICRDAMHAFGYPTPPVALDAGFWADALATAARSLGIVVRRRARKKGWRSDTDA